MLVDDTNVMGSGQSRTYFKLTLGFECDGSADMMTARSFGVLRKWTGRAIGVLTQRACEGELLDGEESCVDVGFDG